MPLDRGTRFRVLRGFRSPSPCRDAPLWILRSWRPGGAYFRIGAGWMAAASLAALWVGSVGALDAPHNEHLTIQCNSCHVAHSALGTSLTKEATNSALCQSCHNDAGQASFFPMPDSSRATPGTGGSSHGFGVLANNPTSGAGAPTSAAMSARLDKTDPLNPKITCSVCHNQHTSSTYGGRQRVQSVDHKQGAGPATFGTLTVSSTATPRGFLVDFVVSGAVGTATYRLSYDNGTSWFGWNGTQWGALGTGAPPFNPRTTGASQNLTNTSGEVVVSFSGSFNGSSPGPSDQYKFYIGYPFFRVAADSGDNATGTKFCRDCHSARAQTHTDVETYVAGVKRSHPVGQSLNANSKGYDRGSPLDVSGVAQGPTVQPNYLVLDTAGGNLVQCTTCHLPHYAPSNSLYDPQGKR